MNHLYIIMIVAEAAGKYLVVYGVLQIRRNIKYIGNNHTLKRGVRQRKTKRRIP